VHLDARGRRDVGRGDLTGAGLAQVHAHRLVVLAGDDELLEVQHHLGDVLGDAGDGGELVQHPVDAKARDGGTRDGRQQRAPQRVSEGVAKAWLQRLENEPGAVLADDLFGQCRPLCNQHWEFPFVTPAI
jgi:hypothetical protein